MKLLIDSQASMLLCRHYLNIYYIYIICITHGVNFQCEPWVFMQSRSILWLLMAWPCFYQTRSAWSADQGSNKNHSPAYNFAPTVTKFCVMWEGLSLPHDTKFGNCRCKIVDSRSFPSWSLIHGLRWSGLIKVGPGYQSVKTKKACLPVGWQTMIFSWWEW